MGGDINTVFNFLNNKTSYLLLNILDGAIFKEKFILFLQSAFKTLFEIKYMVYTQKIGNPQML